jgi:hypothetical protein
MSGIHTLRIKQQLDEPAAQTVKLYLSQESISESQIKFLCHILKQLWL